MRLTKNWTMITGMGADLLERLFNGCRHQFSWPRRTEGGDYYQLCVHCGVTYRYDWKAMKRVGRVSDDFVKADAAKGSLRKCGTRPAWTPRERRLAHRVSIMLRVPGTEQRIGGTTENISRSGVLLRSAIPVPNNTTVEMVLEMPRELAGEEPARVVCQGTVVRVTKTSATKKRPLYFTIACTIGDYKFAPASERPSTAYDVTA